MAIAGLSLLVFAGSAYKFVYLLFPNSFLTCIDIVEWFDGSVAFILSICYYVPKQVKMELNNVDESMGLDALLTLASGLPSHDSSLEDPLAMSTGDWVTSGCHGNEYGEGEKDLEESTTGPSVSAFSSASGVNIASSVPAVEEIRPTKAAAVELVVIGDDSSFSRQD